MTVSDRRRDVVSVYSREPDAYEELWAPYLNDVALELVDVVPPSRRILDVATGVGTLLPDLRDRLGPELLVGVDLVHAMVARSDPSFGRLVGDAVRLPLRDATFDLVVMAFVLFHLDDPRDGLAEARRVLAPGGTLATVTWHSDSGFDAGRAWDEELDRHGAPPAMTISSHDAVDTPEKMESLLTSAGFGHPNAWIVRREVQMDADRIIALRRRLPIPRGRLEALDPDQRTACVDAATARLRAMPDGAFRAKWEFVLTTARG